MIFPKWCELPEGQSDQERAVKRLRFLLNRLAILTVPECTYYAFAQHCGISKSRLHRAMRAGACTADMAMQIERTLGREMVRAVDLMYPLEIETNS